MAQRFTIYPLGNAETCLLELNGGGKVLFDYAAMKDPGCSTDVRYDIKEELGSIKEFDIVMFSHAHDDHVKGASEFFYLEHAKMYQSDDRAKIKELWISAAFLLDTSLENGSDAKIIRSEARCRLKNKKGVKIFGLPDELLDWLKEQEIDYNDVSHLIVHAGTLIDLPDSVSDELQVFVHAPFSDDSEEVQDKNNPSIVLQVRVLNNNRETNLLITGDTPYKVLDKIVEISQSKNNEKYLSWDIYDIPHHCSYTGLNEKGEEDVRIITPTDNLQWLLKKSGAGAYLIASCDKVTEDTSPPHICAKRAYEKYSASDATFMVTMEHVPIKATKPTPIRFEIDELGLTLKEDRVHQDFLVKSAPRAG